MAHTSLSIAFGLAAFSLFLMVVVRLRQPRETRRTASFDALFLVPAAILIGTLPGVLGVTNDALRISASITSIVLSVAAVILLVRARLKESA